MADTATAIERIDIFGYDLTYAHGEYVMSTGARDRPVAEHCGPHHDPIGARGFGETCPLGSTYLPAFGEGARAALRELAPALLGVDAANLAAVNARDGFDSSRPRIREERHRHRVLGHPRSRDRAVRWRCFLAVSSRSGCRSMWPCRSASPGEMQAFVERERDEGIHRFQLKLGGDPEDDLDRAAAVHAVTRHE